MIYPVPPLHLTTSSVFLFYRECVWRRRLPFIQARTIENFGSTTLNLVGL